MITAVKTLCTVIVVMQIVVAAIVVYICGSDLVGNPYYN